MKMIAQHTIHGAILVPGRSRDGKEVMRRRDAIKAPGEEFDTTELGISDEEAESMIATGAARRKTREVVDDGADTGAGPGASQLVDLDAMTRSDLEAHAAENGIDVSSARSKADVIAAIRAYDPA